MLFNAKAILLEEQSWYYLTHSWEDKGFHTFPKGICPKVNVIARLEYELADFDSSVHHFNHYTTWILLSLLSNNNNLPAVIWFQLFLILIICSDLWFQVIQFNTNNFQTNLHGSLIGTLNLSKSRDESNSNEG